MMLQKDLTESCIFDGLEEWELEVGRYEKKKARNNKGETGTHGT